MIRLRTRLTTAVAACLVGLVPLVGPSPADAIVQTETQRLSLSSTGQLIVGGIDRPTTNDDGNIVAFEAIDPALAPGETGIPDADVFVRNQTLGTLTLASVTPGGNAGSANSFDASLSDNGSRVVFTSLANNLGPTDTHGGTDIYLRDLTAATTTLVSVSSAEVQGNGPSQLAAISGDGTKVAFTSTATNLVPGDTNGKEDVFVRDLVAGTTARFSALANGTQGNGPSTNPSISDDGSVVAFQTDATNLNITFGDNNAKTDVYVRFAAGGMTRISHPPNLNEPNGNSTEPFVRGDGEVVVFQSTASNLIQSGDTNGKSDIFSLVIDFPAPSRVSVNSQGTQGNGDSRSASVSDNGLLVSFQSNATNLAPGDTNNTQDVFIRDFATNVTSLVSVRSATVEGNALSGKATVAGTAPVVLYFSAANNLVTGDTNAGPDLFRSPALRCDERKVTVDLNTGGVPTASANVVRGTSGADTVKLLAGADRACMGSGDDNVQGGTESDRIFGSFGVDTLRGEAGGDFLFGEGNRDRLVGGADADTCDGGEAQDTSQTCETLISVP